jgi:hypothetical protein
VRQSTALVLCSKDLRFIQGANNLEHPQNYFLRALKELHIGFSPTPTT